MSVTECMCLRRVQHACVACPWRRGFLTSRYQRSKMGRAALAAWRQTRTSKGCGRGLLGLLPASFLFIFRFTVRACHERLARLRMDWIEGSFRLFGSRFFEWITPCVPTHGSHQSNQRTGGGQALELRRPDASRAQTQANQAEAGPTKPRGGWASSIGIKRRLEQVAMHGWLLPLQALLARANVADACILAFFLVFFWIDVATVRSRGEDYGLASFLGWLLVMVI